MSDHSINFEVEYSFEIEKTPDSFEIPLDDKVTDYKTQKEIAKKVLDESLKKK